MTDDIRLKICILIKLKFIPARQKGKKVIARAVIEKDAFNEITRTTLPELNEFITNYKDFLAMNGAYSLNIHAANGMAAMFQAMG